MKGWTIVTALATIGLAIAWWATGDGRYGAFVAVAFLALVVVVVPLVTGILEKRQEAKK